MYLKCSSAIAVYVAVFRLISGEISKGNYNKNALYEKYPDYGVKWIFMPDGDDNPQVTSLNIEYFEKPRSLKHFNSYITFRLYTRRSVNSSQPLEIGNTTMLKSSYYDHTKPSKFITHGWLSSGDSDTCQDIKKSYLRMHDVNVIVMDWKSLAGNYLYPIPATQTKSVGERYAELINFLIDQGTSSENIHLIGHSLGAHISGFAAGAVHKGPVARVTGLDPALPLFHTINPAGGKLNPKQATFVDVIHTCGGAAGFLSPLGHADFYPNGGTPSQPGCFGPPEVQEGCSHGRAWKYFEESIWNSKPFVGYNCSDWNSYVTNKDKCSGGGVPMGTSTPGTARGRYFLSTMDRNPYAV